MATPLLRLSAAAALAVGLLWPAFRAAAVDVEINSPNSARIIAHDSRSADRSFSTASAMFFGPDWFRNALANPAAFRSRANHLIYGESYHADVEGTYVGTVANAYTSDNAWFTSPLTRSMSGRLSVSAPVVPNATNAIDTLQWNSAIPGASFVGSNWYNTSTNTSGVGPGGVTAFNVLKFMPIGTANSAPPAAVLSVGPTSTSFSALTFENNFNATNTVTLDKSTSGNVQWHVAAGGTITSNATNGVVTFSNTGTGGFKFDLLGAATISVATGGSMVFNAPVIFEDGVSVTGSIIKSGGGTLTFAGANTYTGGTTVNAGTFLANNAAGTSATGAGFVTVNNGGTLGGGGFINASSTNITINSGGKITGGTNGTVGTLTLTANTLFIPGTFVLDLNGGSADRLTLTGNLNITGGTLDFNTTNAPTQTSYTLLSYSGTLTGTFTTLDVPDGYEVQYHLGTIDLVAIPEMNTWIGAALGALAIGFMHRRRLRGLRPGKA